MIHVAISHVADQLNQYLNRAFGLPAAGITVVAANMVELDGTVSPQINDKIILCLVNVEKDTSPKQPLHGSNVSASRRVQTVQPLYLNLYLMVVGHFAKYDEALKFLSAAIAYFQRRPIMDHTTTPTLHPQIERLSLEIENLKIQELSNLWSIIGGKYLPSVLYKIRMIVIDSDDVIAQVPTVRKPQSDVTQPGSPGETDSEREDRQKRLRDR